MCTGIRLKAHDSSIIYARTLEFGREINSNTIIIPRKQSFIGTAASGKAEGLQWQSKYAVVGANACNIVGVIDGVNEGGLAGGLFYFSGYAQFQQVPKDQAHNSLAPWELMTWILTNFATVAEIKKALPTIYVNTATFGPWGITPPVHAIMHDSTGASLVIEYIKGTLAMHDNLLGVFTNAPSFDWHLTNVQNYLNLTAINVEPRPISTLSLAPLGQGSGMLGLPGDFTSPSRFIRAVAFSQSVIDLADAQQACQTAFHILDLFDIPKGVVRDQEGEHYAYDYTQWTSAADLHNQRYYFHTYNNRTIHMIDLKKIDLSGSKPIIVSMQSQEKIINITPGD